VGDLGEPASVRLRWSDAPLRYVGVHLADSEPVDGPPSSAHDEQNSGRRTISRPCGPGALSRASQKTNLRLRRHSPISICCLLRLTNVVAVISLDLCDVHHNGGRRRTGGYLDAVWAGGTIQASGDRLASAAVPASTLIVPATRPRRLPCSGWDGPAVVPAPAPPAATPSHPAVSGPERDRGARRQSTVADRAGGPPASLRRSSEGDQSLW
jgi:hypothetical protein